MSVKWYITHKAISYEKSIEIMNSCYNNSLSNIHDSIMIFNCNHTYTYTASCEKEELKLINNSDISVVKTDRGGKLTYHGPGQRMIYVILNLSNYKKDFKWYLDTLQNWIINILECFRIQSYTCNNNVGIWCNHENKKKKLVSIGIRIRKWVTMHGICINLRNNTKYFDRISPCGLNPDSVTSCEQIGKEVSEEELDVKIQSTFYKYFSY